MYYLSLCNFNRCLEKPTLKLQTSLRYCESIQQSVKLSLIGNFISNSNPYKKSIIIATAV